MTTIGFSPFSAIRANDLLVAELAAEFHPLAVGQRLLQKEEFLSLAAGELRRARFLDRDEFLMRFLSEFLERNGVEPRSLLAPPKREDHRSKGYCPVCLAQYVRANGNCEDCHDTGIVPFA